MSSGQDNCVAASPQRFTPDEWVAANWDMGVVESFSVGMMCRIVPETGAVQIISHHRLTPMQEEE